MVVSKLNLDESIDLTKPIYDQVMEKETKKEKPKNPFFGLITYIDHGQTTKVP